MRSAVVPATDFVGNPIGSPYQSEFSQSPMTPTRPARLNGVDQADCAAVAANRAQDVQAEGFDDKIQRAVYAGALADCHRWYSTAR